MTAIKRLFQEGDAILYLAFLWQFPFSWRWILIDSRGVDKNHFNEYMDVSLYLGEVLLLGALFIYILNNKIIIKSIYINVKNRVKNWFHVEQFLIVLIVAYLALNIAQSIDPILSLTFIGHAAFAFLFVFMSRKFFVSRGTLFLRDVFKIICLSLLLQTVIAGYQVLNNHSVGLYWLNESKISIESQNVAKSQITGVKILRGYGTFPHPNVLAAFCLLSYVLLIIYKNLFHVKQFIIIISTVLIGITIILTGSKTGAFLFLIFFLLERKKYMFHVKQSVIVITAITILSLVFLYQADIKKSFSTRIDQFNYQSNFSQTTFLGTGLGTYRYSYESDSNPKEWWILEPVHNSLYIAYKEFGALLIFGFIYFLIKISTFVSRGTSSLLLPMIIFLLIYFLTEHFFWDIQQGIYIFALALTLIFINIDKYYNILYFKNKEISPGEAC